MVCPRRCRRRRAGTPTPWDPMTTVRCLPCSSRTFGSRASAYLRPSWKMWPISIPRRTPARDRTGRAGIPGRARRPSIVPSAEVPARHEVSTWCPGSVGAGHPRSAVDDPWVDEVADPGLTGLAEHLRSDVPLLQRGAPRSRPPRNRDDRWLHLCASASRRRHGHRGCR